MNKPNRIPLNIPSTDEAFARRIHRYSIPPPSLPPWPWRATMICALNCYLLWSLTWVLVLIAIYVINPPGINLWFYYTPSMFGPTIPELFLGLSIALSIFAMCIVIGTTGMTPKLWKRMIAITVFSGIAIGVSLTNFQLRHYCYEQALATRDWNYQIHQKHLAENENHWLKLQLRQPGKNTMAIGATVTITDSSSGKLLGKQMVSSDTEGSHPRLHFGLGKSAEVDIRVTLPSTKEDLLFSNIAADHYLILHSDGTNTTIRQ